MGHSASGHDQIVATNFSWRQEKGFFEGNLHRSLPCLVNNTCRISLLVLIDCCQIDTNPDISKKAESSLKQNVPLSLACGLACGLLSWLMIDMGFGTVKHKQVILVCMRKQTE